MNGLRVSALLVAITAVAAGCRSEADAADAESQLAARQKRVEQRIAAAATDSATLRPVAQWVLPEILREVSGLAITPDGRILAHNDESATVYVIDPKRGVVLKKFSVGANPLVADFEAITVSGSEIFMLESNGRIYQFREGEDEANVRFVVHDTKLGKECEFEGLAVQPGTGEF